MESVFRNFPLQLNPITSIGIQFALAYIPHFIKVKYVIEKVTSEGKKLDGPGSRQQAAQCVDNTPTGKYIGALTGAHLNGLEALTYHSAAILSAIVAGVPADVIAGAAGCFTLVRTAFTLIYLSPSLNGLPRTLAFFLGIVTDASLLVFASQYYNKK